jgi:hypothetical protein
MARSIEYWYNEIISEKERRPALNGLDSNSKLSIFRIIAEVFAVVVWSLDQLFDLHKQEVSGIISTKKPHKPQWYRDQALLFQYGQELNNSTGTYDNSNLSDEEIERRRIVRQAAVTEVDGRLTIKLATLTDGKLGPLSKDQLNSFNLGYIPRIKDAGVVIEGESRPPDLLRLELDIWFNPLVLRSDGKRIDGSSPQPVMDAIVAYLRALPFNGEYSNVKIVDALQRIDGVELPVIKSASAQWGLFPYVAIDEKYIPSAGYLEILKDNLIVRYREYIQY